MNSHLPLVSIVVLTYNSIDYILETLDSIKKQDYPNIEIVISDDGSSDGTCSLVDKWISDNSNHFIRAINIKSYKNRGICHNYNQGVFNSSGVYIKTLDGDDCLSRSDSISKFVNFAVSNNVDICISDVELISNDDFDMTDYRNLFDFYYDCVEESYEQQKKRIVEEHCLPDPAMFFSRKLYDDVGGFDEKYVLLEEWPFFYNILNNGYKVFGINERLVNYRVHAQSVSHNKRSRANTLIQKDLLRFFFHTRLKIYLKSGCYHKAIYNTFYSIKRVINCYL